MPMVCSVHCDHATVFEISRSYVIEDAADDKSMRTTGYAEIYRYWGYCSIRLRQLQLRPSQRTTYVPKIDTSVVVMKHLELS